MKLAISSSEKNLDSQIDLRFGRAKGFIIYDLENDYFEFIDNVQNLEATQGAGIQAATGVVNEKVEVVLSPSLGPKATDVLKSAGVKSYLIVEKGIPLIEVLKSYKDGKLKSIY